MSHLLKEMKAIYTELAEQTQDPVSVGLVRGGDKVFDRTRPVNTFRKLTLEAGKKVLSPDEYAELKEFLPADYKVVPRTNLEKRNETRFGECAFTK